MGLQKEMDNIRVRKVELQLSEVECEILFKTCGGYGLSVPQLLESFIRDLAGVCHEWNGNEMQAKRWLEHRWSGIMPEDSLLKWLQGEFIDVKKFLALPEDINTGYKEIKYYEEHPDETDGEEFESIKAAVAEWEEEFKDYKTQYKEDNPKADWDKEIEKVKEWYSECESIKEYERRVSDMYKHVDHISGYCPKCRNRLVQFDCTNYCSRCGTKLDWGQKIDDREVIERE